MNKNNNKRIWLSEELRNIVTRSGLQQKAIAQQIGVSPSALCNAINGKHDIGFDFLCRIVDVCGYEIAIKPKGKSATERK